MQLDAYHTFMLTAETKISSYYSVNCAQLKRAPNSLGKIKKNPGISGGNCNMVPCTVVPLVNYCNSSGPRNIIMDWTKT